MTEQRVAAADDAEVADVERWLDDLDPASEPAAADGRPLRRLSELADGIRALEAELPAAVAECRAAGFSWGFIGEALGTTRQAAFQRYGRDG